MIKISNKVNWNSIFRKILPVFYLNTKTYNLFLWPSSLFRKMFCYLGSTLPRNWNMFDKQSPSIVVNMTITTNKFNKCIQFKLGIPINKLFFEGERENLEKKLVLAFKDLNCSTPYFLYLLIIFNFNLYFKLLCTFIYKLPLIRIDTQ